MTTMNQLQTRIRRELQAKALTDAEADFMLTSGHCFIELHCGHCTYTVEYAHDDPYEVITTSVETLTEHDREVHK